MNPEQQRIAIAEACGWNGIAPYHGGGPLWGKSHLGTLNALPDYLNDLNAMHEAEKVLTESQMTTMSQYLHRKLGMLWGFATADQRAEAFLKTLNLWTEL